MVANVTVILFVTASFAPPGQGFCGDANFQCPFWGRFGSASARASRAVRGAPAANIVARAKGQRNIFEPPSEGFLLGVSQN